MAWEFIPTFPTLLGVRLAGPAPIRQVFLGLEPGIMVLYGKNGAGKTKILEALVGAFEPKMGLRCGELLYKWPLPQMQNPHVEDPTNKEDLVSWFDLTGNPWNRLGGHLDANKAREQARGEALPALDVDKLIDSIWEKLPVDLSRRMRMYAVRLIVFSGGDFRIHPELVGALAKAAVELAEQGHLLYLSTGHVRPRGQIDESTPSLRALRDLATSFFERNYETYVAQVGHSCDDWYEATWSIGAGTFLAFVSPPFQCEACVLKSDEGEVAPPWYGEQFNGLFEVADPPAQLVLEDPSINVGEVTRRCLERRVSKMRGIDGSAPGLQTTTALLVGNANGFALDSALAALEGELSERASEYLECLLETSLELRLRVFGPDKWLDGEVLTWTAIDRSGVELSIEQLSKAQSRWATVAIQLALLDHQAGLPTVIVLDEPEAALHRRAERHMVRGLSSIAKSINATVIVATHSPALLRSEGARLVHVRRDSAGNAVVEPMTLELRERIEELGLDTVDLVQFCRKALLVEGQHELVILQELFREELSDAGVEVLALRGASNLKNASDAQLLFRFTDADLVVMLDNENSQRITDIWNRACEAHDGGRDHLVVLAELASKDWTAESKFLNEFCSQAIHLSSRNRISFSMMSLPDIIDYLPVKAIAPKAQLHGDWPALRARHKNSGSKQNFKTWMSANYDARYDDETIRAAVGELDYIPSDFTSLLRQLGSF